MLSEEMLIKRAGNFTASENHRLMCNWNEEKISRNYDEFNELYRAMRLLEKKPRIGEMKKKVDCDVSGELITLTWRIIKQERPPEGLVTYAQEKAIEELFHPDPSLNFSTAHTRNGEEREPECMALLSEKTGLNFVNIGEDQVHIHSDQVGCTPDGVILDELDLIQTGAEVKCKAALGHAEMMLIKTGEQMKKDAFKYFVQVQTAMLVTDTSRWYFANYNPFAKHDKLKFGFIIVERDEKFISILNERIEMAKSIKAEFYNKLQHLIND